MFSLSLESDFAQFVQRRERLDKISLKKLMATQSLLHDRLQQLKNEISLARDQMRRFERREEDLMRRIHKFAEMEEKEEEEEQVFFEPALNCVLQFWDSDQRHELMRRLKRPREDHLASEFVSHKMGPANAKTAKHQFEIVLQEAQEILDDNKKEKRQKK